MDSPGAFHVGTVSACVEAGLGQGKWTPLVLQLVLHLHQALSQLALFIHQLWEGTDGVHLIFCQVLLR